LIGKLLFFPLKVQVAIYHHLETWMVGIIELSELSNGPFEKGGHSFIFGGGSWRISPVDGSGGFFNHGDENFVPFQYRVVGLLTNALFYSL